MEKYLENLRLINEPENVGCSMGIVPANLEPRIRDEKHTIIVPELTSMNRFLFDHYRDDMVWYPTKKRS